MVLVKQTSFNRGTSLSLRSIHPDGSRILGIAGALVFNIALLMLLMAQVGAPSGLAPTRHELQLVDIPKRTPPPPLPPTVKVEQKRTPIPVPTTRTPPQPVQHQAAVQPTDALPLDPAVFTAPPADPAPAAQPTATPAAPGPSIGMHLEYASAPPPTYPREQQLAGVTGTVVLEVLVDVDGTPLRVDIHDSSGNRQLDRAAREQVLKHWRFRPAMRDGQPVQAVGLVPIDFRLD